MPVASVGGRVVVEVTHRLGISFKTVETHRGRASDNLGVDSMPSLIPLILG
jgi:FixJ family two-component response regulator